MAEPGISLNDEVRRFDSADDQIALGDLTIRKTFARNIEILFAVANGFVLVGLGVVFGFDCHQLASKEITPAQRIVNSQVVMALLGATTIQLGTVVLTVARAIFPSDKPSRGADAMRAGGRARRNPAPDASGQERVTKPIG